MLTHTLAEPAARSRTIAWASGRKLRLLKRKWKRAIHVKLPLSRTKA